MHTKTLALGIALAMSIPATSQNDDAGVSRDLARVRAAAVQDVVYELQFNIFDSENFPDRVMGAVVFDLIPGRSPQDGSVLDYFGSTLELTRLNGIELELQAEDGKLRLPPESLREKGNRLEFRARLDSAPTGTPLTVYRDTETDDPYFYTLLVPSDAHRLFPCFDQPDLKARFQLTVLTRKEWNVSGNALATSSREPYGLDATGTDPDNTPYAWWRFQPSEPLPTYLFAFAVGPFTEIVDTQPSGIGADPTRPLHLYCRQSQLEDLEQDRLFQMHRDSLSWLGTYFDTPYPFGKLDLVLLPGFPYGGMEHAGTIFYREAALVFDHEPTESELLRRSTLIYHEVSHQWFGNLVTMEWFDDLWLKEGFATFMGYTLLDVLEPGKNAWLRFHQRVKPRAYAIDSTEGTTPIFQELANLADAKSAYGAIVYNKAPAVIRELHTRLGAKTFRKGVGTFLKRHAYSNARWQDLAKAFDEASSQDSSTWSDRWILSAGMPRVQAEWSTRDDGTLTSLSVRQASAQAGAGNKPWPLALDLILLPGTPAADPKTLRITLDEMEWTHQPEAPENAPACVLLNPTDVAYGLFVLDPKSASWLCDNAQTLDDLLLRATAMSALWNTVREAELDPRRYLEVAIRLAEHEEDAETLSWLLDTIATTLGRYLPETEAQPHRARLAETLHKKLQAGLPGRALQTLRFLVRQTSTAAVRESTRGLLTGDTTIPHLNLGDRDRFLLAASLLAHGDPGPLDAEIARAGDKDVQKQVFMARAAAPNAETKRRYMELYNQLGEPPEQWMQDSLSFFHWAGQSALTEPHLADALSRVQWVKQHRRIFFMPAWLDAFINAHSTATALKTAESFLTDNPNLPTDIRRKLLQSLDGLKRAVRIRAKFG